ncbi:hypothetical protein [Chitinasiproducens palmae]|uniref:Uncharacterized protein n=1 Tax=Chitinasiproducens palmae TaxID=1770053 RepID=A0A1H2PWE9_9BURK|nr:hypothetical protein [Chitinasiproducens palmae]SDV51685.1 hypothetical protein SAMN05216551_1229 [Chitinasiproducens palmae]
MTILRQQLLGALRASLQADAQLTARVAIGESVLDALDEAAGSTLVIHRGGELPRRTNMGVTDRFCEVLATVIVRAPAPDVEADRILEIAHPIIVALDLPGLISIEESVDGGADPPMFGESNSNLCLCTTHYVMHYRTSGDSLGGKLTDG